MRFALRSVNAGMASMRAVGNGVIYTAKHQRQAHQRVPWNADEADDVRMTNPGRSPSDIVNWTPSLTMHV